MRNAMLYLGASALLISNLAQAQIAQDLGGCKLGYEITELNDFDQVNGRSEWDKTLEFKWSASNYADGQVQTYYLVDAIRPEGAAWNQATHKRRRTLRNQT